METMFMERQEELKIYRKFVDDTSMFWSLFRFKVAIKGNHTYIYGT